MTCGYTDDVWLHCGCGFIAVCSEREEEERAERECDGGGFHLLPHPGKDDGHRPSPSPRWVDSFLDSPSTAPLTNDILPPSIDNNNNYTVN